MSQVSHHAYQVRDTRFVEIRAVGGDRRERGSATGALIRKFGGTWKRIYTTYSETYGFDRATYVKYECTEPVTFEVHTGSPSWHQARAGAISAGITSFWIQKEADEYLARYKASHPNEPAFLITKA